MSFLGRILKSSENVLSKNWAINYVNPRMEFASRPKKLEFPLPPKRPLSAYLLFCQENRIELVKQNPDMNNIEQTRRLAQKWDDLTIELKKPFELKARENVKWYGEEHKRYYEGLSDHQKEELARFKAEKKKARTMLRVKRALRNSNVPKAPVSAYILFIQSQSKGKSDIKKSKDFFKEVAQKWNNLSGAEKEALEKKAEADKARFTSEMMQWREKMVKEGNEKLVKAYDEMQHRGKSFLADATEKKTKKVVEQKVKATKPKASVSKE